jgi:hypothetical protein
MILHSPARRYGWYLGIIAGVFAALQILISTTAALADAGNLISAQQGLSDGTAVPQFLIGPLLPPVVASYLGMMATGAVMLYLARTAGRLAAYVSGRRESGMIAGGWVALVSGLIWIVLSTMVVIRTHADGTATGLFTSNPTGPLQPVELIGLLAQEIAAGLIGWGLGSLAGQMGAADAPIPSPVVRRPGRPASTTGDAPMWPPSLPPSTPQPSDPLSPYGAWPFPAGEPSVPSVPRQAYRDGGGPVSMN